MSRPADWSPLGLASDPVPGDPDVVALTGRMYVGTADAIVRAAADLTRLLDERFGQAESIDAIRDESEDVANRIRRAEERYRGVGEAMTAYAPKLRTAQSESAAALQRAIDGHAELAQADRMVDYYRGRVEDPSTPPANLPGYEARLAEWTRTHAAARAEGTGAEGDVAHAVAVRDSAAGTAIAAIRLVESSGDLNDSWWDNTVQFIQDHKDTIDFVVNVIGWVATAVMVVAIFIPGLNVIVGVVALIAAAVTLLNAALQFAAGTMGPAEALLNVGMAVLTFVGGRAIASSLSGLKETARTAVATSVRASHAGAGLRGMTQAAALTRVTTVANVSRPAQMAILERLRYVALDYKTVVQIRNIAHLELVSGGHSATQFAIRQQLAQLGTRAALFEGGMIAGGQVTNAVGSAETPLPWRLGDGW
ncbi:hypothetical protein [Microbacterium sp. SS28]|uniref:hypothetical protein n=1 Tax=Microbacterium sp. SS28 TaxID=2919948 RepID=UPI001FAA5F7C|nr:hypothetical protein [Microbacterium sp. SS28]